MDKASLYATTPANDLSGTVTERSSHDPTRSASRVRSDQLDVRIPVRESQATAVPNMYPSRVAPTFSPYNALARQDGPRLRRCLAEDLFHRGHRLFARPRYDVAVGAEGYGDVGVPE